MIKTNEIFTQDQNNVIDDFRDRIKKLEKDNSDLIKKIELMGVKLDSFRKLKEQVTLIAENQDELVKEIESILKRLNESNTRTNE